jgi:hypothetical protein
MTAPNHIMKLGTTTICFLNGVFHNDTGPAIQTVDAQEWLLNGTYHRDNGPARLYKNKNNYVEFWTNGNFMGKGNIDDATFAKHWHNKEIK